MKKFLLTLSLILMGAVSFVIASCSGTNTVLYSFETNGGTAIESVTKNAGEEYVLPEPTREGYAFEGWYLNADFGGEAVEKAGESEDRTFYAKWTKVYTLTLDLDGGTLSAGTSLSLKENANVYDFMLNYVPEKSGFVFGMWFDGNDELAKNKRMTADMTLTARYQVEYSVEVYMQNVEGTKYEKNENSVLGCDYVGVEVFPDLSFTGYKPADNADAVLKLTLTANKSENVLKYYFDREEYSVSFNANYPDGSAGEKRTFKVKYGEGVDLPADFAFEGYCLVGWATTRDGKAEYPVDYIGDKIYGSESSATVPTAFSPERNTALYAVWEKGYIDLFGGNDYIYLFEETSGDIYLVRGNVFFKGEYMPASKTFLFENGAGDALEGKLDTANGTYSYKSDTRVKTYTLFINGDGLHKDTTVTFDKYNGLTYISNTDGVSENSSGYYTVDSETGLYTVTFDKGAFAGQTKVMAFRENAEVGKETQNVFYMRNDEEVAMGEIPRFGITPSGSIGTYVNSMFSITLNGLGTAGFKGTDGKVSAYYYVISEEDGNKDITLITSQGIPLLTARLMENGGTLGYMTYNADLDLNVEQGGAKVTLDGLYNITYNDGSVSYSGTYVYLGKSIIGGGYMVNMYSPSKNCVIVIDKETHIETNEAGEEVKTTTYSFKEKPSGYQEYYYCDDEYINLVLNDEQSGKASLYFAGADGKTYTKIADGTYTLNNDGDSGVFVKTNYYAVEGDVQPSLDMSAIDSFVFNTGVKTTQLGSYEVIYRLSSEFSGVETKYGKEYTSDNGEKLVLVSGFAVYSEGNETSAGKYSTSSGLTTVTFASSKIYLKLDEETGKFVKLAFAPYSAYEWTYDGKQNSNCLLYFDGTADGAIYVVATSNTEFTELKGTYKETGKTEFGSIIYTFTGEDGTTFEYIRMNNSSSYFFAKRNAGYAVEYEKDGSLLELDGFSYSARLNTEEVPNVTGFYYFVKENTICWYTSVGGSTYRRYIDINSDGTFKVRGMEYGDWLLSDNRYESGRIIHLDGYGTATVKDGVGADATVIDENAKYTQEDGVLTLTFKEGNQKITLQGKLMSSSYAQYFVILHEETAYTFVNTNDYSVLILDEVGNAVKYDTHGVKTTGSYILVSDGLLFYQSSKSGERILFSYDVSNSGKATATPISTEEKYYFTSSLEALIFTRYGYIEYQNAELCFYTIDNDRDITIYRKHAEGSTLTANEYGFEAYNFGPFESQKQYEGKTYYEAPGRTLEFKRGETGEDVNNYPLPLKLNDDLENDESGKFLPIKSLKFNPVGSALFTVNGTVKIGNKDLSCQVIRRKNAEGVVETYLTVALMSGEYFRFDLDIDYRGEDSNTGESLSSYKVTALSKRFDLPSYSIAYYQYMFGMLDSLLGTNYLETLENTFGEMICRTDYDIAGEMVGEPYVDFWFGENSGIVDLNGNLFDVKGVPYEYSKGLYTVNFTGDDGYDYRMRFQTRKVNNGVYGYGLVALTRVQTFMQGDLKIEIERIVGSEMTTLVKGNPYRVTIYKLKTTESGTEEYEEIKMTNGIIAEDGSVVYISRTYDETDTKKIIATTYYDVRLTDKKVELEEENKNVVPAYESVEVTETVITTYYAATEKLDTFADVDETNGKVRLLSYNGRVYLATQSVYDAQTNTYTVTTYAATYTVKITEGVAEITEVTKEQA